MAVESGQSAQFHTARFEAAQKQAFFIAGLDMVVTNVWWIADYKVESSRRLLMREIGDFQGEVGMLPDQAGGLAVERVDLKARRFGDPLPWKGVEQRRIEGAGADGRVEKMHLLPGRQ